MQMSAFVDMVPSPSPRRWEVSNDEGDPVSPASAPILSSVVGGATQCFASHSYLLPRYLAPVPPARRHNERQASRSTSAFGSPGGRSAGLSEAPRRESQGLDRDTQLPPGSDPQFLWFPYGP